MFQAIYAYVASDQKLQAAIYSVVSSLLLAVVTRILAAKARLRWGRVHQNHFLIKNKDDKLSTIVTHNYTIANTGRVPARNVEATFNWQPEHYEVWPHLDYSTGLREDGRFIIKVPRINSGQLVGIAIINSGNHAPDLTYVGMEEGSVREIPFTPQRVWPIKITLTLAGLNFIGLCTLLYWIFRFLLSSV